MPRQTRRLEGVLAMFADFGHQGNNQDIDHHSLSALEAQPLAKP
jgi:hypothetical protein